MYKEITVDRSLFYIHQHHVDTFQSIAEKMDNFNYIIEDGGIQKKDAWIVAFNVWLLLLPDKYNIIQSVEKTLYYSSNFIIYNALKENVHFLNFKNRSDATKELYYLASLVIANGLNQWFLDVMNKYDLKDIAEKNNTTRNYFDAHTGTEEEVKQFAEDQARFVKATVKEFNYTNTFDDVLKKSCNVAYFLYVDHFLNQNKYALIRQN